MDDISKKNFWMGIVVLIILRILTVALLMNNVPFTEMQPGGFRPNFGGSYWPDETNYFELAKSFSNFSPEPNVANVGYPLFLAPIIYLTGAGSPVEIAKIVFVIQAFLFFGLAIILSALIAREILGNKKAALAAAAVFTSYPYLLLAVLKMADFPRWIPAFHYQMWIVIGADYLSAVLLYFGFYLFIKNYSKKNFSLISAAAIGIVMAAAALVRVADIFYLPLIFLIFALLKKYRESLIFGLASFMIYLPQWAYNFYFFGSPFTYGYRIKELSGHGLETDIIGGWLSFGNVGIFFEKIWQNIPALIWLLPVLILILAAGFWKIYKRNAILSLIFTFWVALNIGFYIFFVDAQSQLRYFIPSIPPLIILFTAGIIKIYEFRRFI